ncbi:enoyl-CoA hydratase-related protein [Micromonospora sp. NPDC049523]|uniref:enoyl-CoA hydratase-related protein n=1 Tax=Micromonospora sp. NPDC049523 TaxID=3155921 RepID=UPI003434CDE6
MSEARGSGSRVEPDAPARVRIEDHGAVRVVAVDRPARRNALDLATKTALISALRAAEADGTVGAVVLTGSDRYFVAGTDIEELARLTPADHLRLRTGEVFDVVERLSKPTIAAVEGFALGGGCELAIACDLVVAGESARFGQPEIRVGLVPGAGGLSRLVRAAGRHRALRFVLTGDQIGASEAGELGIVSEVVPDGTARTHAIELAERLLAFSPLSVTLIRQIARAAENEPLTGAIELERRSFQTMFGTRDHDEGLRAFLEHRDPQFTGE